jgi:S-layer homology domain
MTIIITKTKLALAILAIALLAPAAALANNIFADVDDGAFYADPVDWAFNNNITTGKTPTSFAPLDNVTRGESVTFLKRYNDNIVEPATTNLFASDTNLEATTILGNLGLRASVTIPEGRTGVIEIDFSAESACFGGTPGWCKITLLNNGTPVNNADFAFDSNDGATEGSSSYEGHAMTRVTDNLPAGTYVITASSSIGFGTPSFWLDDMVLTAEIHLTN